MRQPYDAEMSRYGSAERTHECLHNAITVLENKRFSIWYDRFEYKNPGEYISSWWETEGSIRYPNVPDNAPEYTPVYARFRHQSERE